MDRKTIKKHGIDIQRLNKKLSKSKAQATKQAAKKEQKEAEEKARREALIKEVLSNYEISEELPRNHKVTYEDIVVKEYDVLLDTIIGLNNHLKCATFLSKEEKDKIKKEIENFKEIKENLIKKDELILVKAKRINK